MYEVPPAHPPPDRDPPRRWGIALVCIAILILCLCLALVVLTRQ